jgi:hypothetical protein
MSIRSTKFDLLSIVAIALFGAYLLVPLFS